MSSDKGISVPKWDGKNSSAGRYVSQVEATAEYWDCADCLDPAKRIPTKSEFDALNDTNDADGSQRKLFKENKKMGAVITLGQMTDHGLALINKTKSDAHPHGMAREFVKALKAKCTPSDTAAEMELENQLELVKFNGANDYYNSCVAVKAKFDVVFDDTKLIKIMAKKVSDTTFSALIIDHLKGAIHDFEALCEEINVIQRVANSKSSVLQKQGKDKEVQLANAEFKGKCFNCNKNAGHRAKDCPEKKENGGGGGNGDRTCNYCGKKGHTEDYCWLKNPEKAPKKMRSKLYAEKKKREAEAAGGSVEIMIASIETSPFEMSSEQVMLAGSLDIEVESADVKLAFEDSDFVEARL